MYNDVCKFIDACDQEPSAKNVKLYKTLIDEEVGEFRLAYYACEEVEQLDACMMLIVHGQKLPVLTWQRLTQQQAK